MLNTVQKQQRLRRMLQFAFGIFLSIGLAMVGACSVDDSSSVDSWDSAQAALTRQILPKINVAQNFVSESVASRYTVDTIKEPLPNIESFPLYGAAPKASSGNDLYLEIYSSSEKANADRQNERWLVDVADAFNKSDRTTPSGQRIQVGIRKIDSGSGLRLIESNTVQPAGYSPSNALWLELAKGNEVGLQPVADQLVTNTAGWVVPDNVYQTLSANGPVTFETLLGAIASKQITVAYPNPYTSSTALNFLHSLYWRAAGHHQDGKALTVAELQTPQVQSIFEQFQSQVLLTTTTTLDLQEIFLRDQTKLQAFPLEYQNYLSLKQVPGFEQTHFIPFGLPHTNPLVGFDWNSPDTAAALQQFAQFAQSADMQALAKQQGFVIPGGLKPTQQPQPTGEVLKAVQSNWKLNKDNGQTVYLEMVIDTSGSMDGEPLKGVQDGLRVASQYINPTNQVGLVSFGDHPTQLLPLAPFDELQHKKFLATVDQLRADGATAMYDGVMVALANLLEKRAADPDGRFYLLLLSDGAVTRGHGFRDISKIMEYSEVRFYPIAYGNVDMGELGAIANLRESTVKTGNPETVQTLFKDLFQVNL
ncbi:MAG: vWA domain-containing protein [Cyanobacteria bacterium P01_F01_bin.150]